MSMRVEIEREEDGRWIAEIPAIPGALCYAASKEEALVKVTALALRILPEQNPAGILVRAGDFESYGFKEIYNLTAAHDLISHSLSIVSSSREA
jgi:hypothetical protein